MTKFEDNQSPYLTLLESAAPGTPSAGLGKVYEKVDGQLYFKNDAGTESQLSGGAGGISATIFDAKGDIIAATAADTASRLTAGSNGRILVAASGEATGLKWAGGLYMNHRLLAVNDNVTATANVNSTSYISPRQSEFYHDWDFFPATHFMISMFGQSNEAAQTVSLQLAQQATPTDPVSAAGDDLVISNTQGIFSSGWIAVSDVVTGLTLMTVAHKGSNISVDFNSRWLDIAFKIA